MAIINFSKLKTSWTKYDIVQVMDVVSSEDRIERYKSRKIGIDEPILRSFLGIKNLQEPTPDYWIELQNFPNEKRIFALFAVIFTHIGVTSEFANDYCTGDMKGVFKMQNGKQYTNIRSALVESGAAEPKYRRTDFVPFDFSPIFKNGDVGKLFKELLLERIARVSRGKFNPDDFYSICYENNFHKAISISASQFKTWIEGNAINQIITQENKDYNLDQFYRALKKYTQDLLDKKGWDLAFELVELNRYEYILHLKEKKWSYLSLLDNNVQNGQYEISAFKELYNDVFQFGNRDTDNNRLIQIDSTILIAFEEKIFNEFEIFGSTFPDFIPLLELVQQDNISHIDKVYISNLFSVKEANLEHINGAKEVYFLGENGDGKSLLLIGIYLAFNRYFVTTKTQQDETGRVTDILNGNPSMLLSATDEAGNKYGNGRGKYLNNLLAYGTYRGRYNSDKAEEYGFMSLFDNDKVLMNPVQWLMNQKLFELEKQLDERNMFGETKELPNSFSVSALEQTFSELLEKNVNIRITGRGVLFSEKGYSPSFEQLSEGYKSVLVFVCDMIFRLNKYAKEGQKLADLKGVVLVDEIDLHLHIKWQKVIVRKLRNIFPAIQFIFTTHSPAMIQGASDDAIIYRVYRNSIDGETKVSDPYYRKDLNHLMINTLVTSPLFGLDDSRLDTNDDNSDTSETYLLYKINKQLEEILAKQKSEGKVFISDEEIDKLIQKIINEELGRND